MSSEWEYAPLGDVCSRITYGFTNPMPTIDGDGAYMVTAKDIKNGRIQYQTARKTSWDAYRSKLTDKSRPAKGDLLLTKDGSIGRLALCDRDDICINQSVALLQSNNKGDFRYIKYLLEAPEYQRKMESDSDGSTIKHIYITRVDKMIIPLPPRKEQQGIVSILGTLDDKIELNRKTNETLEAMAKALFKSWFVDFDPVRAKAEGRPTGLPAEISDLFPDSFEDSELGEIPSGWKIKKIGDVISRFPVGKRFDQKAVSPKGSIPVLDQSASGIVGYHDEEAGVLATKDFPLFTFANHTCAMRYMTRPFSVIQNVFPLRGNGVDTAWLYQASQGKQEITEYKGHYPDFIEKEVVIPSNGVDKIYGVDYERILIKCDFNLINSVSLASIRDALLPKLISGEIRIPDAEKMLEEIDI